MYQSTISHSPKAIKHYPPAISQKLSAISHQPLIFILLLLLTACHTIIDPQLPQIENTPTVNAILQQDYPLKVKVSQAEKLDSIALQPISNAQVQLFVNGQFIEELIYTDNDLYEGETLVEAGKKYLCKVIMPGFDTLFCEDEIPLPEKLLRIEHINIAGKDEEGTSYPALQITFSNNPEIKTYYEIQIFLFAYEGDILYPNLLNVVDPVILNEGLPILLFSNETIADSAYTMHINYNTGASGGERIYANRTYFFPLVVELRTVSYHYYHFRKQYYLYEQGRYADGILESMTSAPNYSNVENGRGIFAGYSSMLSDTIKPAYER